MSRNEEMDKLLHHVIDVTGAKPADSHTREILLRGLDIRKLGEPIDRDRRLTVDS